MTGYFAVGFWSVDRIRFRSPERLDQFYPTIGEAVHAATDDLRHGAAYARIMISDAHGTRCLNIMTRGIPDEDEPWP